MLFSLIALIAFCLPISYIDFRKYIIPDVLIFILQLLLVAYDIVFMRHRIPEAFFSAILSFLIFFIIYRACGGLGFGDVKFSATLGYALGFPMSIFAFILASFLGIVYAGLVLRKNLTKIKIPFAPFLSLGAIIIMLSNEIGLLNFYCF